MHSKVASKPKGIVDIILSDPPCIDWHVRYTCMNEISLFSATETIEKNGGMNSNYVYSYFN